LAFRMISIGKWLSILVMFFQDFQAMIKIHICLLISPVLWVYQPECNWESI
jgi:ABC-type polysaccharide/polyol phosphate export permease